MRSKNNVCYLNWCYSFGEKIKIKEFLVKKKK